MLRNQWGDAPFGFSSLNDRKPVDASDDIIVLAAPDPPGADDAIRISQGEQLWAVPSCAAAVPVLFVRRP